jgi:hypothetical protein
MAVKANRATANDQFAAVEDAFCPCPTMPAVSEGISMRGSCADRQLAVRPSAKGLEIMAVTILIMVDYITRAVVGILDLSRGESSSQVGTMPASRSKEGIVPELGRLFVVLQTFNRCADRFACRRVDVS